ncbi:MAG TPA: elongation factor 1-beta [Candidatus Nanoarchaeia archaeon]|nr:elongation factor 1-beta [Candidatus Nanoarchaeia archaeon]
MATVIVITKLMPESPSVDMAAMKKAATLALEKEGGKNISIEEKPIAFGLKALYVKTDMDESKGTDLIEEVLGKIPNVSSVTIEDYRRAFG